MNKKYYIFVVLMLIVISFYSGVKYSQFQRSFFAGGRTFGGNGNIINRGDQVMGGSGLRNQGQVRGGAGGMINGEIISTDDTGITVKLRDGGSKIVFISEKTSIVKSSTSTKEALVSGLQISGFGTANPDGSINAENIQIR